MNCLVKPFEDAGGFTVFRNVIFDEIMPSCKPNTWKVICAVMRKTIGWNKETDRISFTQFQELTGIKQRATLTAAIKDALDSGYIIREQSHNSFVYSLNREFVLNGSKFEPEEIGSKIEPVAEGEKKMVRKSNQNRFENRTKNGSKIEHTKDKRQETVHGGSLRSRDKSLPIKQPPTPLTEENPAFVKYPILKKMPRDNGRLAYVFWEATGIVPLDSDLKFILKITNDMLKRGITPQIVRQSVDKLRRDKLVISGIQSVLKVSIALKAEENNDNWSQEDYEENKRRMQEEHRRIKAEHLKKLEEQETTT